MSIRPVSIDRDEGIVGVVDLLPFHTFTLWTLVALYILGLDR